MTPQVVRQYLQQCYNDGRVKPVTVLGRLRALRVFFNFLVDEGVLMVSPVAAIRKPKVPKYVIKVFSKEDINAVLAAFPLDTFIGFRNYFIMATLFSTGMRRGELLDIRVYNIRFDNNVILVNGKGSKERLLPLSPLYKKTLTKYLKLRTEYLRGAERSPFLIINRYGYQLSIGGLNSVFGSLKEITALKGVRVSAHTWRHTFAKLYLLNGGDLFSLQRILGHEDITTTRIYVDMNLKDVKQQNDKFNPLDNARWQYY